MGGHKTEYVVGLIGNGYPLTVKENNHQCAEQQEERDYEELCDAADYHVFARLTGVAARKIALHHVLIETGSGYGHEYAGEKLLPEERPFFGIVKEEYA